MASKWAWIYAHQNRRLMHWNIRLLSSCALDATQNTLLMSMRSRAVIRRTHSQSTFHLLQQLVSTLQRYYSPRFTLIIVCHTTGISFWHVIDASTARLDTHSRSKSADYYLLIFIIGAAANNGSHFTLASCEIYAADHSPAKYVRKSWLEIIAAGTN